MKIVDLSLVKYLINSQYWLLGIAANLVAIHLTLTSREGDINLLLSSILFLLAASSLVWQKRHSLNLESGFLSSFLGVIIITGVLLKSAFLPTANFLGASPFVSALGLSLLTSGFRGLKQYWQELLILFFLGVPKVVLWSVIDVSAFTAQLATYILWYFGFDVYRQEFKVMLLTGGVDVNRGCSGVDILFHLLGLAVLFLVMFPVSGIKKIFVPIVAVLLAFVVNGFRVALMSILVASQNKEAFDYWHVGNGSLIFSMIAILLFGLFCYFLLRQEEPHKKW